MKKGAKKVIKSSVRASLIKLVNEAVKASGDGKRERSRRYVQMAMDLVRKHKVRVPAELKNSFCRKCLVVWVPGDTVTVTFDRKHSCVRAKCVCGHSKRL